MNLTRIDQKLQRAYVALTNVADHELIQTQLARFGYTEARLAEGMQLYEQAHMLVQHEKDAQRRKMLARQTFLRGWKQAQRAYHHDLRGARLALRDYPEARHNLQLVGLRKRTFAAWSKQARHFYRGLLDDENLRAEVVPYGITDQRLQEGLQLVNAAEAAYAQQRQQMGAAHTALRERDEALAALQRWILEFSTVARLLFRDTSHYLVMLGLTKARVAHKPQITATDSGVTEDVERTNSICATNR